MPALGTYAEDKIINLMVRNTSWTPPTTVYLALYLTTPTAADVGTEVGGGGYLRQAIVFAAPSGGVCLSSADVTFPIALTSWGNVAYAAIRDASTGGNLLFYGNLVLPRFVSSGDVLKFLTGNVAITVT